MVAKRDYGVGSSEEINMTIFKENKMYDTVRGPVVDVIDGDTVLVSSDKVKNPLEVRYAWGDARTIPNLFNKDGLPASPFRTDDWPGVTFGEK